MINQDSLIPHIAKQQCSTIKTRKKNIEIEKLLTVGRESTKEMPMPHSKQNPVEIKPEMARALSIVSSAPDIL